MLPKVGGGARITNPLRSQPYVTASQSGSPLLISATSALAVNSYPSSNNSLVVL